MYKILLSKTLILITILFSSFSWAEKYSSEISVGLGMNNISFAETKSVVTDLTRNSGPIEGTASLLTADIRYKLFPSNKLDYFIRLTGPLFSDGANSYFGAHVGASYYFVNSGSKFKHNDEGNTLTYTPKLRIFAGLEVGTEYLIYSEEDVKKENDLIVDVGVHAGASYNLFKDWSIMPSLHVARGAGAKTTTLNMQGVINFVYFFKGFGRSSL